MSTLLLTNLNTQAVSTEKHLVELWLVTRQLARHFLALLITIRNIKMPQHAEHQHHNSIINNNNYKKRRRDAYFTAVGCATSSQRH